MAYNVNPKPQQLAFAENYYNPTSPTYGNATQSAIRAGYTETFARSNATRKLVPMAKKLTGRDKEEERVRDATKMRIEMLQDAERVLAQDLKISDEAPAPVLAIRNKTAQFVASTVGKDIYSTRNEVVNSGRNVLDGETGEMLEVTFRKYLINPTEPRTIDGNSDVIDVQ